MDAGKHVFCEKPVASSVAELVAMKDAAERNGLHRHGPIVIAYIVMAYVVMAYIVREVVLALVEK